MYLLGGGGFWFGVDPCSGNPFIKFRAGLGFGGLAGLNPAGGIPGGGSPGTGDAPAFGGWGGSAGLDVGIFAIPMPF